MQMNQKVFVGLLKDTQIKIDTAINGIEALELIQSKHYDVIFLDHMMPLMDGVEAFRKMKKLDDSPNAKTPVVMLTANAVADAQSMYMEEGFSDYLAKPIREEILLLTLKKFLPKELVESVTDEDANDLTCGVYKDCLASVQENSACANSDVKPLDEKSKAVLTKFLDMAIGLAYCMNDQNFFNEMLDEYAKSDKTDELVEYFDKGDFEYYRITVHAIKSTSLTIGATKISGDAKALETACKEGNLDFVKQNHKAFVEEYAELIRVLREERGL